MRGRKTLVVDGEKVCSHCTRKLPIDEFIERQYRNGKTYRDNKCDLCRRKYSAMRRYGLSNVQYDDLTASGTCNVCGSDGRETAKGLCIDHDHDTMVVRGVLCNFCNVQLGFVGKTHLGHVVALVDYLRGGHKNITPANKPLLDPEPSRSLGRQIITGRARIVKS